MASGSGSNLWVWLLGVVVRRYIDFLILLLYLFFFAAATLLFVHFFIFSFLFQYFFVIKFDVLHNFSCSINTHTGNYGHPTAAI